MHTCTHCKHEYEGNFCPNCGRPKKLRRIDGKYIRDEISLVFNFDRGILLTTRELLIRPGKSIRHFLESDRHRLVKPVLFILITSLIYTLINNYFGFEEQYVSYQDVEGTTAKILSWVQENYGYANLLMGVFIALSLKLFFQKTKYNFYEILILLCFVIGMEMLILAFFVVMQGITGLNLFGQSGILLFIYLTWALGDFFGRKNIWNYVKALFAYLLGTLTFFVLALIIGKSIDLIFH